MNKILYLFLTVCFVNISFAQKNRDSLIQVVKNKTDSLPDGFAISIGLLKNGETYYIGLVKQDDELVYSDLKDSLFEIGSLTKVFTSTLLANEVLKGNVKLNKPVNKAFSYTFNNKIKLSYQSLANHTSGMFPLPSNIGLHVYTNPAKAYREYSYDLFDDYLINELQLKQNDVPEYSYSNLGAGLLAYSLSKNANRCFEELLKESIFTKYNMTSTSYEKRTSFDGIGANEKKSENWELDALKGAGGLISSTNDLTNFISGHFKEENSELCLTRKVTFSVDEYMSIGLGWHILDTQTEDEKFWHSGGTGGYTSQVLFRTSNETGVVILSNISIFHSKAVDIEFLCFTLLDLLK